MTVQQIREHARAGAECSNRLRLWKRPGPYSARKQHDAHYNAPADGT
ncbi:hypothetical protein ACQEU6_32465 [Spirillospora sp. CA-108201]